MNKTFPPWSARLFLNLLLLGAVAAGACGADWPGWRGPNRDGVSPEGSGWPEGWPPRRLWSRNVGHGCTSPVVAGEHLYVMGWRGKPDRRTNPNGHDVVYCLDRETGEVLWQQQYATRYQGRHRMGDLHRYGGPSSTPTFDAQSGNLYTLGIDGELRCWDARARGRLQWFINLYERYAVGQRPGAGKAVRDYGFVCSPLVRGDAVIVEVGDDEGTLMAFDKRTGERRWTSQYARPAGHTAGPVPIAVGGRDCVATLALEDFVVVRADSPHAGETLARHPWRTEFACNIPTPAVTGRRVLLTSGYNHRQSALLTVSPSSVRADWTSRRHALVSSPVIHKGQAFVLSGSLACLDLGTGRTKWSGGRFGHGSCIVTAGDDRLIVFGEGDLALVAAQPASGAYTELARIEDVVPATCYPHVAFAGGVIYCKDKLGNLVALSVRTDGQRRR